MSAYQKVENLSERPSGDLPYSNIDDLTEK